MTSRARERRRRRGGGGGGGGGVVDESRARAVVAVVATSPCVNPVRDLVVIIPHDNLQSFGSFDMINHLLLLLVSYSSIIS